MNKQAKPVLTLKGRRSKSGGTRPTRKVTRITPAAERKRPARPQQPVLRERSDAEVLAELRQVAPDLWDADAPVPLAVGIHKQLYPIAEKLQMSRKALRKFLSRWTSAKTYQEALSQPGAERFNLDGSSAGEVQEQHQEKARERVTAQG